MADVTLTQGGKVRMFNIIPDENAIPCNGCAASYDFAMCNALPDNCVAQRVHFVEVL
jgi:hypothetical protein